MRGLNKVLYFVVLFGVVSVRAEYKVRVLTENYPPLNYEENGIAKGYSTAILKYIFDKNAVKYDKIEFLQWNNAYNAASGEANVALYTFDKTKEREALFWLVGPISETYSAFVILEERKNCISIKSLEDAKNYMTGSVRGDSSEEFLIKAGFSLGKNIDSSLDFEAAIKKLFGNRIDAIYMPFDAAVYLCKKIGLDETRLSTVYKTTNQEREPELGYIGFCKKFNTDELPKLLQATVDEIRADGTFDKIVEDERNSASKKDSQQESLPNDGEQEQSENNGFIATE